MRELTRAVEARDVARLQVEHVLERRLEDLEVLRLARGHPGLLRVRGRARDLARELGRDVDGLVLVAPQRAVQRRVVGVGVGRRQPRLQRVEELAEARDR